MTSHQMHAPSFQRPFPRLAGSHLFMSSQTFWKRISGQKWQGLFTGQMCFLLYN